MDSASTFKGCQALTAANLIVTSSTTGRYSRDKSGFPAAVCPPPVKPGNSFRMQRLFAAAEPAAVRTQKWCYRAGQPRRSRSSSSMHDSEAKQQVEPEFTLICQLSQLSITGGDALDIRRARSPRARRGLIADPEKIVAE